MSEKYIVYKNGQLMETANKDGWEDWAFLEYARHKYGDCFVKNCDNNISSFNIEQLGYDISEWFEGQLIVEPFEIWEKIHELLSDFEYEIYCEAEHNLKNKGIKVEVIEEC